MQHIDGERGVGQFDCLAGFGIHLDQFQIEQTGQAVILEGGDILKLGAILKNAVLDVYKRQFVFIHPTNFLVLSHKKQSKRSCNVPMTNIRGIEQH